MSALQKDPLFLLVCGFIQLFHIHCIISSYWPQEIERGNKRDRERGRIIYCYRGLQLIPPDHRMLCRWNFIGASSLRCIWWIIPCLPLGLMKISLTYVHLQFISCRVCCFRDGISRTLPWKTVCISCGVTACLPCKAKDGGFASNVLIRWVLPCFTLPTMHCHWTDNPSVFGVHSVSLETSSRNLVTCCTRMSCSGYFQMKFLYFDCRISTPVPSFLITAILSRNLFSTLCRMQYSCWLRTLTRAQTRGELSYLAPLGSENISAPYFKQCFFLRGGGLPPRLSETPRLSVPRQK